MNTIAKKTLLIGFALLLSACVHYPQQHQQHSYYPSTRGYSSGYTIMHRNYYGERPDHYQRGHGRTDYSHHDRHDRHDRHDQYNTIPHRGSNYQNRQQQRDRSNGSNNRHNNVNRRNHD